MLRSSRLVRSALVKASLLGLACGAFIAAAHADVYKYKDDKGNVLYTDKPMFLPAERLSIKTEASSIVDIDERNAEEQAAQSERDAARRTSNTAAAEKKKNREADSAGKAEACNKARQDYLARMNAQRLFEEQPNGEKRFLSEKELESARSSAKQAMDALCN